LYEVVSVGDLDPSRKEVAVFVLDLSEKLELFVGDRLVAVGRNKRRLVAAAELDGATADDRALAGR
jgi:hypothetical protein